MPTTFTITSEADLNAALASINVGGASAAAKTNYVFDFTPAASGATIATSGTAISAINLMAVATLTISGHRDTFDSNNLQRGLFVYSGAVIISDLTIANTSAIGGCGLGAGGAIFVQEGGSLTIECGAISGGQ